MSLPPAAGRVTARLRGFLVLGCVLLVREVSSSGWPAGWLAGWRWLAGVAALEWLEWAGCFELVLQLRVAVCAPPH